VLRELAWVDEITGTCFACFDRFEVLATVTMLYFAAAIYCEERERAGQAGPDEAFLLADDETYRQIASNVFRQAPAVSAADADRFAAGVQDVLEPYNLGGLCDPQKRNMYSFTGIL
jgi:FADH2 O2-dependent halogenase